MTKSECSTSQQQQKQNRNNSSSSNIINDCSVSNAKNNINNNNNHYNYNYNSYQNISPRSSSYRDYHNINNNNNYYHQLNQPYNYQNHNHHYNYRCNKGNNNGTNSLNLTQLNHRQVERLRSVLQQNVEIHGRENFPTLNIPLQKIIVHVKRKIEELNLQVKHVKLNGGAASYVLATADNFSYLDVDLIFPISLATEHDFDKVRTAVFDTLLELMPESINREMISSDTMKEIYIRKMIRVLNNENDRWSLFSLHNNYGRCIELKFVDKMRRQFEFSVDSFQITLDRLLENVNEPRPIIQAESMYGDFCQALSHLNKRLIDTRNPEEIRGGGLLKYCYLLTRGYRATYDCRELEKYMCSRFFIDFPEINAQEAKLCAYLDNHFGAEFEMKLEYLHLLYRVIKESTICLMGHERRQTLLMVENLHNTLEQMQCYNNQDQLCYTKSGTVYYNNNNNNNNIINEKNQNNYSTIYYINPPTPSTVLIKTTLDKLTSTELNNEIIDEKIDNNNIINDTENFFLEDNLSTKENEPTLLSKNNSNYVPRQTLLYFPPNGTGFELVELCKC